MLTFFAGIFILHIFSHVIRGNSRHAFWEIFSKTTKKPTSIHKKLKYFQFYSFTSIHCYSCLQINLYFTVGHYAHDLTLYWRDGRESVGINSEIALPLFSITDHETANELISLSNGIFLKF